MWMGTGRVIGGAEAAAGLLCYLNHIGYRRGKSQGFAAENLESSKVAKRSGNFIKTVSALWRIMASFLGLKLGVAYSGRSKTEQLKNQPC